jgi:hypothetical protein
VGDAQVGHRHDRACRREVAGLRFGMGCVLTGQQLRLIGSCCGDPPDIVATATTATSPLRHMRVSMHYLIHS